MPSEFSTGSPELDRLLEELRAGDNVVLYTPHRRDYRPFVSSLIRYLRESPVGLIYVRSAGALDDLVASLPGAHTLDLAHIVQGTDPLEALEAEIRRLEPRVYYLFEPLESLAPWFGDEEQQRRLFLTLCPLLFRLESVAYWHLTKGAYRSSTIAAIKDCTQIFLELDRSEEQLLITPLKVWGRYSETMFRTHRVVVEDGQVRVHPLPLAREDQQAYTLALAAKNRELTEIRDALNQSNLALQQRNEELAELNERLSEQSRLYQSLRQNLDHLLDLFHAGQDIGSSLAVDQVSHAIVKAALRLLDTPSCRLRLADGEGRVTADIAEGVTPEWAARRDDPAVVALRTEVCQTLQVRALRLPCSGEGACMSLAIAPLRSRGVCLGTLEVYGADTRLDSGEALILLSYLASEAGIALDNALLYREVDVQGQQLRSFVENVITNEEQDSRRLAFDLHDGLVQLIVASYQHLQTAQAWHSRDPQLEEREIDQGIQLLRRAIYEARRLISQLRPTGLDDFGLVHALRLYVAQLAADADWEVSLDVAPDWAKLPPALEAAMFRIVQEATTNARKYAEARRVKIDLSVVGDRLCVNIRDWGKGFEPSAVLSVPQEGLHMGLIGIRERARLWGGECVIRSELGEGTTVRVCIPRAHALTTEGNET